MAVLSVFSQHLNLHLLQQKQGYRNRYNLINCHHIFTSFDQQLPLGFKRQHFKFMVRFCELMKVFHVWQNHPLFISNPWSSNKIIPISIALSWCSRRNTPFPFLILVGIFVIVIIAVVVVIIVIIINILKINRKKFYIHTVKNTPNTSQ